MSVPGPFVIDASVFLNAFNPRETGSEVSKTLLERLKSRAVPIITPFLLLPETAAAISRGQNDPTLASQFATTLQRYPYLILISLDRILGQQALEIAAAFRLRGSDAVYAAVAQRFACSLITLDREQHDRVATLLSTHYPIDVVEPLGR